MAGSDIEWYYKWKKEDVEQILTTERVEEIKKILKAIETGADLDKWVAENPGHELADAIEALLLQQYSIFNDPIHGPVKLHPLLTRIINTTEFSRLRHLKQLGGACYVYHGAIHTRFEHSIGVCYLAGEFVRMLKQNQPTLRITDKEVLCVEVAALCHDLGHGPFSHMFEKRIAKVILDGRELKHEKLSQLIFERIYDKLNLQKEFSRYGLDKKEKDFIKELIDPAEDALKSERRFLFEIVCNRTTGIDVDKWDYFERDATYLHVPNDFQARRLMSLSRVLLYEDQRRICYPDKELQDIYGMFHTRCSLHQRAYKHKTVKAIDQMIADAIIAVQNVPLINISSNHCVLLILENQTGPLTIRSIVENMEKATAESLQEGCSDTTVTGYLALTDNIIELIKHGQYDPNHADAMKKAQELITRLEERDIYHRIAKEFFPEWPKDREGKQKTDRQIEDEVMKEPPQDLERPVQVLQFDRRRYYIEIFPISHGSQDEERDPMEKVLFYSKGSPVTVLSKETVDPMKSRLMMPQAFHEHEIRLYRKASIKDKDEKEDELKKAFKQWCGREKEKQGQHPPQ